MPAGGWVIRHPGQVRRRPKMNEDAINIEIRKVLKKVGITSQREVEKALQAALESGR